MTVRLHDGSAYTVEQVVDLFPGMTEHWLRKAVRENRVPHMRPSRSVILFTDDHVEAMRRLFEVKAR